MIIQVIMLTLTQIILRQFINNIEQKILNIII